MPARAIITIVVLVVSAAVSVGALIGQIFRRRKLRQARRLYEEYQETKRKATEREEQLKRQDDEREREAEEEMRRMKAEYEELMQPVNEQREKLTQQLQQLQQQQQQQQQLNQKHTNTDASQLTRLIAEMEQTIRGDQQEHDRKMFELEKQLCELEVSQPLECVDNRATGSSVGL